MFGEYFLPMIAFYLLYIIGEFIYFCKGEGRIPDKRNVLMVIVIGALPIVNYFAAIGAWLVFLGFWTFRLFIAIFG